MPRYSNIPQQFDRWIQSSRYAIKDIEECTKKLLVYYPKKIQAIKPIITEISHQLSNMSRLRSFQLGRLYSRVIYRYKKELLPHFELNLSSNKLPLWRKGGTVRSLKICKNSHFLGRKILPHFKLRKDIKLNKGLKSFELDGQIPYPLSIFKQLKYIPSLETIYLKDFPLIFQKKYNKPFLASKLSLKNVIVALYPGHMMMINNINSAIQFFRLILELPRLEKFHFSFSTAHDFDVDKIPFNILNKRDISYRINVNHQKDELVFSTANQLGLEDLEFLGIHFKDMWIFDRLRWDIFEEESMKAQENCRRMLFLDLFDMKQVDLSQLFTTCKNIHTLEVILSYRNSTEGTSFRNLRTLQNLKHIFIELSSISDQVGIIDETKKQLPKNLKLNISRDLFKNLTFCAQTLRSVNLHLYGQDLSENKHEVISFFKACSYTLTHITLKFTFEPDSQVKRMRMFYKGLEVLKRLESLNIIYSRFDWRNKFGKHSKYLKYVLSNKEFLKEFSLLAPTVASDEIKIDYIKLGTVEKLRLDFGSLLSESKFLSKSTNLANLKYLELTIRSRYRQVWNELMKVFCRMSGLQILLFNYFDYEDDDEEVENREEKNLVEILKTLFKSHNSLGFLAFGGGEDPAVIQIFVKKQSLSELCWKEVDNFFGRSLKELPRKRTHKIWSV